MRDYPIIFSAPMVRALLEGRKTMTRRLATSPLAKCAPSDRLWVREAHGFEWDAGGAPGRKWDRIIYRATDPRDMVGWAPSIHMPRWASRITLEVTGQRVEPVQAISPEDAAAEGIEGFIDNGRQFWKRYRDGGWNTYVDCPVGSFASLWTELHGPGSWEANPDVVAITFTVRQGNIDKLKDVA